MFCVSEYRLFVKQGYGVHSAIHLGYKNALILTENVCSAYTKSTVLDCIDTTSIKSLLYVGVCVPFPTAASLGPQTEPLAHEKMNHVAGFRRNKSMLYTNP